jgi:hypothetical protein
MIGSEGESMQSFAALTLFITLIVATAVGVRLLQVAKRTRELPEALFGAAFVAGGVGQGMGQLGQRLIWSDAGAVTAVLNMFFFGIHVAGTVALWLVIWRVFQAGTTRGIVVFAIGSFGTAVAYGMRIGAEDFVTAAGTSTGMQLFLLCRASIFCWAAMEAFYHYGMLRRRAALGLGDPIVANQILLWGIAGVLSMSLSVLIGYYTINLRLSPLEDPFATALILFFAAGTSVTMWCAFFPPGLMRRWLGEGAAPAG